SVGGDHAITGPILKAIAGKGAKTTNGEKTALLHFDAHRDDYQHIPHWLGSKRSAAHWAHYTVVEEHVDPEKSIQLGMRGNPIKPREDVNHSILGYKLITADDFFRIGTQETIRIIRERVGDSPLYITFDLDVLDPTEAPAVSNLEPLHRGLRAWECLEIFHGLRGMNIIGADIVCMIPSKDTQAKITGMTAQAIMFEFIALISDYLNSK
ncbi:MAG: agmatinase, partial [Rhodospirillales bacterium]|nr:agmatinase [Rhodospirillales bacterium]